MLGILGVVLSSVFTSKSPPTHSGGTVATTAPAPSTTVTTSTRAGGPTATTTARRSTSTTSTAAPTTTQPVTTPPTVPTSSVLVEVLNGMGQSGAASTAASALRAQGFVINGTGDAASFSHVASVVAYPPGGSAAAHTLAAHVSGAVTLTEDTTVPSNEVDLVVGSSFTGVTP